MVVWALARPLLGCRHMLLRRPSWPLAVALVIGVAVPGAWAARRLLKPLFSKGGEHAIDIGPIPHGLTSTDGDACGNGIVEAGEECDDDARHIVEMCVPPKNSKLFN